MVWPIIAAGLGVLQYRQQKDIAKQQQYDIEAQAEAEKTAARDEELTRREQLNKVLAANVQSVSAMPSVVGSPQSVSLKSAQMASQSEASESVSDRIRQDLLKRKASQAKSTGRAAARSTLLNAGVDAFSMGGKK